MSSNSNHPPPPRLTHEDAMTIWRARDAYRVQGCLYTLLVIPLAVVPLGQLLSGHWDSALVIVGVEGVAVWALRWLLRRAWWGLGWLLMRAQVGLRRWWQGLVLVLLVGGTLSGCHGYDCWVAGLHGYTCDRVAPVACTPGSRQAGYCAAVQDKEKK